MAEEKGTKTGYVWSEKFNFHDTGNNSAGLFLPCYKDESGVLNWGGFSAEDIPKEKRVFVEMYESFENPATKRRMHSLISASGMINHLVWLKERKATDEQLRYFHSDEYINRIKTLSRTEGTHQAGDLAPFTAGCYDIALYALGGCLQAVDAVMKKEIRNAYSLIRPIGHHAERDRGRGFCIFNNSVICAHYLQKVHGLKKVAIVDWDVHHGNGIEDAFYDDPSVLTISIHQSHCWPADRGEVECNGRGAGKGYHINIPMPPGTGNGGYMGLMDQVVVPALRKFAPEFIIVSSGFDASGVDPLARQLITAAGFKYMAQQVKKVAEDVCDGRLVLCHEGGYSAVMVPFCGLAVMEALSGIEMNVFDPFEGFLSAQDGHEVESHHQHAINQSKALLRNIATSKSKM